jgi:CheY-like chemotaxis protein
MKILIVDDEYLQRLIIKKLILKVDKNINIDEAEDGLEAISKTMDNQYNLILMDLTMPRCSGFQASKNITKYKKMPIIAVTAFGDSYEIREKCRKNGIIDFRNKPLRKNDIEKIFNDYIR